MPVALGLCYGGSPDISGRYTAATVFTQWKPNRLAGYRKGRFWKSGVIGCTASAAGAIGSGFASDRVKGQKYVNNLPEPPSEVSIATVLPFLMKVTFTRHTNYWRVALALSLVVISKATGLSAPYFLKVAVERLGQGSQFVAQCVTNIVLFGLCRAISGLTSEIQFPIFAPISQAAGRRITSSVFQHVLDLDFEYHLNRRSGAISAIIERGARSVQYMFRGVMFRFVPTLLELMTVTVIFGHIFTPLVSVILLMAFVTYIAYSISVVSLSVQYRQKMIDLENRQSGKAVDALQNLETVTLFNNQYLEVHQYDGLLEHYQDASLTYERAMAILSSGQMLIITVGLTLALAVSVMAGPGGRLVSPGDLVFMQGMILQVWAPLSFFGWFYRETRQSITDMKEFLNILQTKTSIQDGTLDLNEERRSNRTNSIPTNGASKDDPGIHLRFNDVRFGYTPERTVLKGVDLDVPAGSSVALVGLSGSGKSTLLSLLVRLYDVESGSVTYDGIDVRELTRTSLRSVIGVVPQDTVLFNDTIYANILYGKPDASGDEVYEAARMAQLHMAIRRLPGGYDTMVGERGLKLSGGEKQRVAIARAFLRSPKLLVCDEATSSLDTATEQEIMTSLSQLAEGRTSVFVAHRLSTIQACDKIVVMSDGCIIEQGTHTELMQLERAYYDMWQAQARRDAIDAELFH